MADDPRVYARLPQAESDKVREIAQRLGHSEAQFVVHCVQGCLAAIEAWKARRPPTPPIVIIARRILDMNFTLGDRLVADWLRKNSKTYEQRTARWDAILMEEVNKIESELTPGALAGAELLAEARWREEERK